MRLQQQTLSGLFAEMLLACGGAKDFVRKLAGFSGYGLCAAVAREMARLVKPGQQLVLVVDEVDQLQGSRQPGSAAFSSKSSSGASVLEWLFKLPLMPGAPCMAIVSIANCVDLLARYSTPVAPGLAQSLLFEPYSADQLRTIFKARLAASEDYGSETEQLMGKVGMELRIRQVAKQSGDCRRLMMMCDEALLKVAAKATEEDADMEDSDTAVGGSSECDRSRSRTPPPRRQLAASSSAPKTPARQLRQASSNPTPMKAPPKTQSDPLASVSLLPPEHQVLLCALAASKAEAVKMSDLKVSFKDFSKRLRLQTGVASQAHISDALGMLEKRGLLELRSMKGRAPRRQSSDCRDQVAELAVSRAALKASLTQANPTLAACI